MQRWRFVFPLAIATLTFIVAFQFALIDPDFHHDGIILQPGIDLVEGRLPFVDSYQQYGLGETLLSGIAVTLLGKRVIAVRLLTVLFYTATAVLLWVVWRKLLPDWLAAVTCLIWLFLSPYFTLAFLPWPSVHAMPFQMLCIFYLARFVERGRLPSLMYGGLCCGLTWLCRQPVGALLFASAALFLAVNPLSRPEVGVPLKGTPGVVNRLLYFCLGTAIVLMPFFLFLLITDALHDWFLQTMVSPAVGFGVQSHSPLRIAGHVVGTVFQRSAPWGAVSLICLIMFMRGVSQGLTKECEISVQDKISFLLATTGLASLLQLYPVPDGRHAFWAATPTIGLTSYLIWTQLNYKRPWLACILTVATLFLLFSYTIKWNVAEGYRRLSHNSVEIERPEALRGMKATPHVAKEIDRLTSEIDKLQRLYPDNGVVVAHSDALWNQLTTGSYRFHKCPVNWESLKKIYPDYEKRLNEIIRDKQPILLTIGHTDPPPGGMGPWLPPDYVEVLRTDFRLPPVLKAATDLVVAVPGQ